MRLPKEFFIKSNLWKVEMKWNLTYRSKRVDGLIDPAARILYIDRSLSKEDKYWTFKHEWRHAVLEEYGIGHNSGKISLAKEEAIQDAFDIEERNSFTSRWKRS